jgi:hydroxyacylglutathione hydrolase
MGLEIIPVPALSDNYSYLLLDVSTGLTAVVDPSEAAPVVRALEHAGLSRLNWILYTHHHHDHVDGALELRDRFGARAAGNAADAERLPLLDLDLGDGDLFELGDAQARILGVPGHTTGAIAWYFGEADAVFTGDTLFLSGCGRLFEGTPAQMWKSLLSLRSLPPTTRVYCGHEYAEQNTRFAAQLLPGDGAVSRREASVRAMRKRGAFSVPGTLGEEMACNPFLRADDPAVAQALGMAGKPAVEVFAEIRRRKDVWKS